MLSIEMEALSANAAIAEKEELDLVLLSEERGVPNQVTDTEDCYQSSAIISQAIARSVESQKKLYQGHIISEPTKEGIREDEEQACNNDEGVDTLKTMVPHYPKESKEESILFKRLLMTKHKLIKKFKKRKEEFHTKIQSSTENQKKLSAAIKNIEDEIEFKQSEAEKLKSNMEYYQTSHEEIEDDVKTLREGFHNKRVKRAFKMNYICDCLQAKTLNVLFS